MFTPSSVRKRLRISASASLLALSLALSAGALFGMRSLVTATATGRQWLSPGLSVATNFAAAAGQDKQARSVAVGAKPEGAPEYSVIQYDGPLPSKPSLTRATPPRAGLIAGTKHEVESNDTTATASPIGAGSAKIKGDLFPNGDIDFYSFTANAGDRVSAAMMTSFSAGSSTDSQMTLFASDGTTVIEFDDDNGSFAALSSSIAGATIPSTGTYYLKVNDFTPGTTSMRPYELWFQLQSGTPTSEVEPNDSAVQANSLPANGWVSGTRDPASATEQDWYSFSLNAGDTVYLSLDLDPERDSVTWNGRLGMALFGDAGDQKLIVDDAGTGDVSPNPNIPSEALFVTVKDAGTYYAVVDSASAATGGPTATYHLSVTVLPRTPVGINCTTYTSTNVPRTIGPNNALSSSTITIPGSPRIASIRVFINLNHAKMGDIDAHLRSPAGNDIGLFTDIGAAATGGQQQMDLAIDDDAGTPPSFTVLKGVILKPELSYRLGWLKGENAGGTWTLDLRDDTNDANGGTLNSWSIEICEDPGIPACGAGFTQTTIFSTDFESGAAGFTHSGTQDEWALGLPNTAATSTTNPVASFTTCNSGTNCWKTDLTGNYNISSNQDLLSPNINLAGVSGPITLNWAMRYQMESATFDHANVVVREVGNPTNALTVWQWLDGTMTNAPGNPVVNVPASAGWGVYHADISSFAGKIVEVVFHLDSDTFGTFGGVAIDDVTVTACMASTADLSITKTDGIGTVAAGSTVTYTIVAVNAVGGASVTGATVTDNFPATLTNVTWTCVGAGGGTCTAAGSGDINDTVNLPAGGSVTYTASCSISGAATGMLANTATVTEPGGVTDPSPGNNRATDTDTISCATVTLAPPSLPNGTAGTAYNQTISASPAAAYSFGVSSGALPTGVSLNPMTGALAGTPTATGTFNFTITATAGACSGSQAYTIVITCPTITVSPATLTNGTAGQPYTPVNFTTTGAFGNSASFSLSAGALPAGMTFSTGGGLSGTPTQTGTFNFTVTATDTLGCTGTQALSLPIACQTYAINPASLPSGQAGVAYSQNLSTTGSLGTVTYSLNSGALPTGLALASNGVISGTPTTLETATFEIKATDGNGCLAFKTYSVAITCPSYALSALAAGTAGMAYSQTLSVTPNVGGPHSFAVTGGALPAGLTLVNGVVSGTPTTAGTFNFQLTATGSGAFAGCSSTMSYALVVNCPTITLTASLPSGVAGTAYNQAVTASPAGGNYSYAVTTNVLPPGLTLNNATGAITGTPTAAGNYTFVITATGWGACTKTQTYNLLITATCTTLTVNPASLPGGTVGTAYSQTLSATGGTGPYTFAVTGGTLPTGLTLSSAGGLSGTPTTAGTFNFTVTATGGGGCIGTKSYSVSVTCPTITLTPASLPGATAGNAYNQTVLASPAGTYNYTLTNGNLPPGLSLQATTGALTGTATATGSYSFSVKAERGVGCAAVKAYTIVVSCPTVTVNPATLPGGSVGTTYSQTLSATPSGSYTFAVSAGALPSGLTLSTAGLLSGTPTTAGTFNFTVKATGFGACNGTRSYTLTMAAACATVTLPSLPANGSVNAAYFGDLSGTQPSGSYTFSLDSGTLPPGLTIDNLFGALTGTPTTAGTYTFTLKATRASGCAGTRAYTVVINSGAAALAQFADYDGDGQADPVLWRAATGTWDMLTSQPARQVVQSWGTAGDVSLLGDYDGDGKTDLAVFRPSSGTFYVKRSRDGGSLVKQWGVGTDVPVPGDYDGDGQTDLAVWRAGNGTWYILRSRDGQSEALLWGSGNAAYLDVPVSGDYDGDGKSDLAVFRRSTGTWLVKRSSDGQTLVRQWGLGGDVPVAGDYDGDGRTDLAVWRGTTGQWFVLRSTDQSYSVTTWGTSASPYQDQPAPGDYDGDGQTDLAVWRGSAQMWYVLRSTNQATQQRAQGQVGDQTVQKR